MQLKAFTIPIHDAGGALEEVNTFLRAHRVLSVDGHFVQDGANSVWAICVSYLGDANRPLAAGGKRPKVDYREVLSEADFAVFAKLRNLRKELAEKEGVPPMRFSTHLAACSLPVLLLSSHMEKEPPVSARIDAELRPRQFQLLPACASMTA